jgi:hypothetical protein
MCAFHNKLFQPAHFAPNLQAPIPDSTTYVTLCRLLKFPWSLDPQRTHLPGAEQLRSINALLQITAYEKGSRKRGI